MVLRLKAIYLVARDPSEGVTSRAEEGFLSLIYDLPASWFSLSRSFPANGLLESLLASLETRSSFEGGLILLLGVLG